MRKFTLVRSEYLTPVGVSAGRSAASGGDVRGNVGNIAKGKLAFANRAMPVFAVDEAADIEVWGVVTWILQRPKVMRLIMVLAASVLSRQPPIPTN